MKFLFDTSSLLAGLRHPGLQEKAIGKVVLEGHTPVLTDYIFDELRAGIEAKYTQDQKAIALDILLQLLSFGVLEVKHWDEYAPHLEAAFELIAEKDAPILATLMLPDIDYLVVRDQKDFLGNQKLKEASWRKKMLTPQEVFELF